MTDQDKRAVEGLARCGISLEGLCDAFPKFPTDEVREIYREIHRDFIPRVDMVKVNCS